MNRHNLYTFFQAGWRVAMAEGCCGLLCCVLLCCVAACSPAEDFEEIGQENGKAEVTFQISTRAVADQPEDAIQTLRIYGFRKKKVGTEVVYRVEGYAYVEPNAATTTVKMMVPTTTVAFYLIANEKAAGPLLVNNQTPFSFLEPGKLSDGITPDYTPVTHSMKELESLTFSKLPEAVPAPGNPTGKDETNKKYTSPVLPMSAVHIERVTKGSVIHVQLTRSVAKMTMHFSKTGQGELFLGRGVYLYNVPKYGYLFARPIDKLKNDAVASFIQHREWPYEGLGNLPADYQTNPSFNDSYLHQRGGRMLLSSGFHDEPENYDGTTDATHEQRLDINRITVDFNDPRKGAYQQLPSKAFYLFANPHEAFVPVSPLVPPIGGNVCMERFEGDGYYIKILAHQHLRDEQHNPFYKREKFYVKLPPVEANDYVSLYSVFTLDGYMKLNSSWMVEEWKSGGGDITFN